MRHARAVDLSQVPAEHYEVVAGFFEACSAPLARIRNKTGAKVPVAVADLSRYVRGNGMSLHEHVHGDDGEGHVLADGRHGALGLYWLPTERFPAGRVEVAESIAKDVALCQEVVGAEFAHAFDYGAVNPRQRARLNRLFHDTPDHPAHGPEKSELGPDGWFEGHEGGYWSWPGERFMSLFMAAYAPSLPRPLEDRQPWTHTFDDSDIGAVKRILRRP